MVMKIGVLPFGNSDRRIIDQAFPLPEKALDKNRGQYRSNQIVGMIQSHNPYERVNRLLGVIDADMYAQGLNFVFGEATFPGKAALISLWRLRPEFYKNAPNFESFAERSLKEAIHEVGHTLGVRHCPRSSCVMHFSNSIFDTDKKESMFCDECYLKTALAINALE